MYTNAIKKNKAIKIKKRRAIKKHVGIEQARIIINTLKFQRAALLNAAWRSFA